MTTRTLYIRKKLTGGDSPTYVDSATTSCTARAVSALIACCVFWIYLPILCQNVIASNNISELPPRQ